MNWYLAQNWFDILMDVGKYMLIDMVWETEDGDGHEIALGETS